jgi:uncharacterized protein YunC (DUF1805 family)
MSIIENDGYGVNYLTQEGLGLRSNIGTTSTYNYLPLTQERFNEITNRLQYNSTNNDREFAIWTNRAGVEQFDKMLKAKVQEFTPKKIKTINDIYTKEW